MSDKIPLGLIGISHNTASVEIREKVALSEEEQKFVVRHIIDNIHADGCMVLSTCNRTEVYVSNTNIDSTIENIKSWLNDFKKCIEFTNENVTYELREVNVVEHFFKVLSGLDSQITGEQPITGQVKDS